MKAGISPEDVELARVFRMFGVDYFSKPPGELLASIPQLLEGRKVSSLEPEAIQFLEDSYDVERVVDERNQTRFHFSQGEHAMSLIAQVAEKAERSRSTVKQIYEALVAVAHEELKKNRKVRLPELCMIKVKYRPAREKGKKKNPFKPGEMMVVKARPAANKLKCFALKSLKNFAEEEIKVVKSKK